MDKEMEQRLIEMMKEMKSSQERAEARQEKMNVEMEARAEARQERADARQKKADAEAKARHERIEAAMRSMRSDIERSLHQQMGALLEGSRSFGTRTTICRLPPATCQTETTSCPEEMDVTNLEATSEATEAAVERQDLFNKEINAENFGSSEDQCENRRLAV
jgi:hypothetical protein